MVTTFEVSQPVKLSYAGIDVGKVYFDAAIHGPELTDDDYSRIKRLPVKKFPRTLEGVTQFIAWLAQLNILGRVRVVMESTGRYSTELYDMMIQAQPSLSPAVVHPRKVKKYAEGMGSRSKNDQIDARVLAYFGVVHRPAAYKPLGKSHLEIRELSRQRTHLVEANTANKLRLNEIINIPFLAKGIESLIKLTDKLIKQTEARIADLLKKAPELDQAQQAHSKVPGVGPVVSAGVVAELGNLSRFQSSRQMVAFVGLALKENSSGKRKGRAVITKQGSSEVRRLVYLAAMACIRHDNRFGRFYRRLIAAGKPTKLALIATGRKILVTMRALSKSGGEYVDNHLPLCVSNPVENV